MFTPDWYNIARLFLAISFWIALIGIIAWSFAHPDPGLGPPGW